MAGWRSDPGALGASGAVNSVVVCTILLAPRATVLLYGILPLPAWLLGVGWVGLDVMGAAQVKSLVSICPAFESGAPGMAW